MRFRIFAKKVMLYVLLPVILAASPEPLPMSCGVGYRSEKASGAVLWAILPNTVKKVYKSNRSRCHRHRKAEHCKLVIPWVEKQFREHKWSPDGSYGYAKRMNLFSKRGNGRHWYTLQHDLGMLVSHFCHRITGGIKAKKQGEKAQREQKVLWYKHSRTPRDRFSAY